jgi:hypothetical protein
MVGYWASLRVGAGGGWAVLIICCAAALLCCCAGEVEAQEGGIETFAANTLFEEGWRLSTTDLYERRRTLYSGSKDVANPEGLKITEHRTVGAVDYGLFPNLTASLLIPIIYQKARLPAASGGKVDSFGLADISVLGKYRIFKKDWEQSSLNLALIGGLEIPTGKTDEKEGGLLLPPEQQPGFGAWNPMASVASTLSLDRVRLDAFAFYKFNTEGTQSFERGDFFAMEVAGSYRFLHTEYPGPTASVRLGCQYRNEQRGEIDGHTNPNSGSDQILLRIGLTVHPFPGVDFNTNVDVPVFQEYKGVQLGLDLRLFFGLGFRF